MFSSELGPEQRAAAIESLATEEFDILVIGGGVTGAGAVLDAASRGLKVALVEARDIASGTSSRSSKLIHGGLRYLEQYDFKLVREALHERELMVSSLSPHLVKPVGFLYPLHEKLKDRTYVGAGLALYDVLRGFQRALPWHKHISGKKIAEIAPSLRSDIVTGAVKYYDAQVDDARHTMTIVRTARRHGATIATRVEVEDLIKDGKKVIGATVIDTETGKKFKVSAKSVVMCAGIWSDEMHERFGLKAGYGVTMSKGVHIIVPGDAIKSNTGIILKTAISVLFLIPWGDKWIVGTTDTPYDGDRAHPYATSEDVQYILDQANKVLDPQLKREEIIGVYAGLRPLVANTKGSATTKLSREHTTDRPTPGFVSIAGGKYTTYRVMGKDAIDLAVTDLRRIVNSSCTEKLPLVGADGYYALTQQSAQIAAQYGIEEKSVIHLLNRYGSMISEVLDLITEDKKLAKPLAEGLPYLKAEIVYAASHEGAMSVDDVISRRTRLAFEAPHAGIDLAEDIATLIAPLLGWGAKEKKASIAEYKAGVAAEVEALEALIKA
ncbi:MAG: glycerol-3-phosphate dehydrogenase/oxidase [Candidatus Planktophila sp.]|jgi:glycerol-3-phosphate dehydrogenase|nr:glycerol-3-phosphate dehydrogenase/oxidase [Candidatus Planktophila sp.]MBP7902917.1 glycerol-3-phosphate dehydrogenase/oxidase [Candidatus Planktophila sp.]